MIYKHLRAVIAIFTGCLLMSCHSDLQLDNLDPTMEAQIKMALPLGTIHAKVSDFLKSNDSMHLEIGPDGTYTWKMKFERGSKFDHFDLESKLQDAQFKVNLYKQLEDKTFYNPYTGENQSILRAVSALGFKDEIFLPYGCEFKDRFKFNMPMELTGINTSGSQNRVDSAFLPKASFKITITKDNFDGLDWNWIDTIKLDLGDYIIRRDNKSSEVILYKKGDPITSPESMTWNMDLGAVKLNLMIDPDGKPQDANVYNEISFPVEIVYEIPPGSTYLQPTKISINENSGIECDFQKSKLEIAAIWGWFKQTQGQEASDTINILSQLDSIPFLKNSSFPIAEPRIDATIKTNAAGDINLSGSLAAMDKGSIEPRYAMFSGVPFFNWTFKGMNPATSNFNDSTIIPLHFSNHPDSGKIDDLFSKMPEKLAFNVKFQFDKKSTPQIRLVNDMYFDMKATATIPFKFKEGLAFNFVDTMAGVTISQLQVDSLLSGIPAIDSAKVNEATLVMTVIDSIPLDLKVSFHCLRKDGSVIMDPEDKTKKFTIFPTDTIFIPTELYTGQERQPITCMFNKARMNVLPEINKIVYTIIASAPAGQKTVIKGDNSLYIKMGITADLNAYINPKSANKGNNQ